MNPFKNEGGDWNRQEARRTGRLNQTWRKHRFGGIMGNAPKHAVRSRGWRRRESHSDASQMLCLSNGTKIYTADDDNNNNNNNNNNPLRASPCHLLLTKVNVG